MDRGKRLFRAAAVAARGGREPGAIVLERTLLARVATLAGCAAAAGIAWVVACGEYTAHVALSGRLVPDRGVVDVRAPQHGSIVARFVEVGSHVARGDVLYVVSSDRRAWTPGRAASGELAEARIVEELRELEASLERQIHALDAREQRDLAAAGARIAALDDELIALGATMAAQQGRIARAEAVAARYAAVEESGLLPDAELRAKDDELLEQRLRFASFEREQRALTRERDEAAHERDVVGSRYADERAELARVGSRTAGEIAEHEARREVAVVAARSGTVALATAHVGQVVEPNTLLAVVLPDGASLQAELEAPSRAVGFLETGDEVFLRYAAYPFQKFGHHRGVVTRVGRVALAADAAGAGAQAPNEPSYRVTVRLPAQAVTAYGVDRPLRAGMAVEAHVRGDTRRIYEWVLEPLYTLAGGIP